MPVLADVKVLPEHLLETRNRLRAAWPASGLSGASARQAAGLRRRPVVQADADHRSVVGDRSDEACELVGAEAVGDAACDVDRDVRVPRLRSEQAKRARDVAVRRVEALERAARVHHRRERIRDRGELGPREAAARCSAAARARAG